MDLSRWGGTEIVPSHVGRQLLTEGAFQFGKDLLVGNCPSTFVVVDHLLFLVDSLQETPRHDDSL